MVFNSGDGSTALDEHIVRVQTLDKISGGIGFPVLKAMADRAAKTALETQINKLVTEHEAYKDKVFQKGWPQHYHEWDTVGSDRREIALYFFRLRNAFLHVRGFANALRHCRANETLQTANHVPPVPCTNSKSCVASESFLTLRHRYPLAWAWYTVCDRTQLLPRRPKQRRATNCVAISEMDCPRQAHARRRGKKHPNASHHAIHLLTPYWPAARRISNACR